MSVHIAVDRIGFFGQQKRLEPQSHTAKRLLAAVHPGRGLDDSHIFTAEMQKEIKSAAHEENWPVLICGTATVTLSLCKLGFDDLLYLVNDNELTSVVVFKVFIGHLTGWG